MTLLFSSLTQHSAIDLELPCDFSVCLLVFSFVLLVGMFGGCVVQRREPGLRDQPWVGILSTSLLFCYGLAEVTQLLFQVSSS